MYRPHDPLTQADFLWPVFGYDNFRRETLAVFFDRSAAEDFAMHPGRLGFERRNLYVAAPRYDRRAS